MQLVIELPDKITQAMRLPSDEIPVRIKQELAIRLYAKDMLSLSTQRLSITFGEGRETTTDRLSQRP